MMADEIGPITYTQRTVAWPQMPVSRTEPWHTDDLLIGSDGSGEFTVTFMRFERGETGVEVNVFGDGLDLFYDDRIQRVMRLWRDSDRDNTPPDHFIAWLEAEGAKPSSYHKEGLARSDEETAALRAMRTA